MRLHRRRRHDEQRSGGLPRGYPAGRNDGALLRDGFPSELEAFRAFARAFPRNTTLLIDTYDTVAGAHNAVIVAREMERQGPGSPAFAWTAAIWRS